MTADCDRIHDLALDNQLQFVDDRRVDLFGFRNRPADFGNLVVFVARCDADVIRLCRLLDAWIANGERAGVQDAFQGLSLRRRVDRDGEAGWLMA